MPSFRRLAIALIALIPFIQTAPASAWSGYGHEIVAQIALANVKPATRAALKQLLAKQALLETPACPARTIGEAARWADCVRSNKTFKDRFSYQDPWHYQNVEPCKAFDLKSVCRNGNCVSAQIERQVRMLKDPALPTRERVQALLLLIHFVGDLHQPLHAVDHNGDGGGNGVRADYGIVTYEKLSLHRIWDAFVAERGITSPPSLIHVYSGEDRARLAGGKVEDWSREAWELARSQVYPAALGPDYCTAPKDRRGSVSEAEIEALVPMVRDQVAKGGLRLARLLDEAFAG
ncbi:MAG: S1/P1 nuclease [Sphingobium sp.]|nr:S1/P1 nuclease [Sphingobium sp.]